MRRVGDRLTLAALVLVLMIGCTPASPARPHPTSTPTHSEVEQPIPSDLREQIGRSCAIGRQLYVLDKVSAIGTDVLLANVPDPRGAGLVGYLPVQEGDASGEPENSFLVSFFTAGEHPRIAYEVRVAPDRAPSFRAFTPPKDASPDFAAMVLARQLAIAAMPASTQPINPVLLPGEANGETGVLVYLLAGTKRPNVAVFGRHFRALVPRGGSHVTYLMPFSKTALEVPTRGEHGESIEALIVTQIVTDFPVETHVFTSLLTKKLVYVATRRGTWRVNGDQIAFLGKSEASAAK